MGQLDSQLVQPLPTVGVERCAVAGAAADGLHRAGVHEPRVRERHDRRPRGVVVSPLTQLAVEAPPKGVQRAPGM
jgi:hypothetical protein